MNTAKADRLERVLIEAHEWRTLITSHHATDDDMERFETWRRASVEHVKAYERATSVYSALGQLRREDLQPHILAPTWRERFVAVFRGRGASKDGSSALIPVGAVLATTFAVLAVFYLYPKETTLDEAFMEASFVGDFATAVAEIEAFDLPDGSKVTLGPSSVIEARFFNDRREVQIKNGSGFFDVRPDVDRPFVVSTGFLTAKVVGTRFDVKTIANVYRVSVAEGQVDVAYPLAIGGRTTGLKTTYSLTPGQSVLASQRDGLNKPRAVRTSDVGAWRDKRLTYNDATLEEVVADLNRFDPRFIAFGPNSREIRNLRLSGAFDGGDVNTVLATLEDLYALEAVKDSSGGLTIVSRQRD